MANLRAIRERITSVTSTQQITRAMKLVAAAKLRKAQDRMIELRPYSNRYKLLLQRLKKAGSAQHPFLVKKDSISRVLLVVVGSDRGLCGGFNNNLFKEIEKYVDKDLAEIKAQGNLSLITIGRKATDFFKRRDYPILVSHPGFFDKLSYDRAVHVIRDATEGFLNDRFDHVFLAFNEFKTVISQNRVIEPLLPVPDSQPDESQDNFDDFIFEPDVDKILNTVAPQYVVVQFWRAVLESNASEQGARMAAMDSATENAQELVGKLKLSYNQARQAAITTEISEIVSGAEALSN